MITQDDAHIFCTINQLDSEINLIKLVKEVYSVLGFKDVSVELSTRPEKYVGNISTWNNAEKILEETLKNQK